jgi:hypothetical protein
MSGCSIPRSVVLSVFAALLLVLAPTASADKLTEANMTEKDFKEITKIESSVPGVEAKAIDAPLPVHDFSAANEKAVTDAHGVKVIKGKDWKALSPKDRDKRMRALRETSKRSILFRIEVPSGNVWAIDVEDYTKLTRDGDVRVWLVEEQEKLPKAVKRDPSSSHSDRSGIRLERVLSRDDEP